MGVTTASAREDALELRGRMDWEWIETYPEQVYFATRHEAAAAWMAAATFHGTGRLAACYGEMGPGAHNLVGGLGTSRANGLAVIPAGIETAPAGGEPTSQE